ncbi:Chemotaxis two-component sensor histidine kinase protein [Neorhizobium galegae bv. officinalis bv. officinalis str. HAMBI 1141]|uniref:Chemotaxis protein CheA n=1 Tax=Neorhizobium galegae bv. officinalis bv. officinalis str. HAMBI 1141 TaxID=1028801 RepID=A0A068T3A5_NEOGA|nr:MULTISPECIES: chemotaxis protein CheA [Neorhizobium]MCJ9670016.1 chemotaxis protein CheA [Neorhizobium sp. SHOUNA12B]MCJ9745316.1 chemotaxis protein CheA [Neorhizobium sp. SHOUNA12A]CDN52579.1 Chemotaxis two-component sensor histidine kinase protein [Neorhizobium galegae bv. officinalis bv. officinalis str. HAMBI 1141]
MDMNEIKEIFFQECEEQLAELESGLLKLNDGDRDPETVNAVFRAVHSIKGGAGAFGLDDLVSFAHVFETTLDCVRSNKLEPTQDVLKVMLKSADVLADLVSASRDGGGVDESRSRSLVKELEALAHGGSPSSSGHDAPKPAAKAAPAPVAKVDLPKPSDDSGFQPVPFSFDGFGEDDEPAIEGSVYEVSFKPRRELYSKGNEAALLLRDLSRLGEMSINCDTDALPTLDKMDPEASYFSWKISIRTTRSEDDIRAVFEFAEWDCDLEVKLAEEASSNEELPMVPVPFDLSILDDSAGGEDEEKTAERGVSEETVAAAVSAAETASNVSRTARAAERKESAAAAAAAQNNAAAAAAGAGQTIRVDLDRVDRLINLVGELVINQAMLSQSVVENDATGTSAVNMGLEELQQLTREIQDSVMAIRAQPVKPVFQRMSRIVREVADMVGKSIRLVTEGENTEVDKTVIDKIAEPLTHMIRNAVDHGIESPEKREAAGKDPEGTIKLTAKHRSGRILIELADDGAGINRERVRQKAIDNDIIAADANLSDDEIDNLIFMAGFSTADKISDISGRGVGMDVVKRSIQALGGRISISSRPGFGSTFTMSLPLTLAVLDGMVVTVAGQTLVVPLTAIVETLQPEAAAIHSFGANQRLISIRNSFCPLVDVGRVLNYRATQANPVEGVALLVESEGGGQRALMVDAIQGQRQVVIKSLEANYTHVPGIAAATILGDGRVALILDVDAVVAASRGQSMKPEMSLAATG